MMMKRVVLALVINFMSLTCFSQKEASVWIVGDDYGIDFKYDRFRPFNRTTFNDGNKVNLAGTSASICDPETGNLLFYSEGLNAWNRNFQIMENGVGLMGRNDLYGQSTLIVPYPGNQNLYYLFTTSSFEDSLSWSPSGEIVGTKPTGLYYSIIDMRKDGGLGGISPNAKNVLVLERSTELLTAVPHSNGRDVWLITHEWGTDRFVVYPITPSGIKEASFISFGLNYNTNSLDGYIKPSPNGKMLAFLLGDSPGDFQDIANPVELYDFDAVVGVISNRRIVGNYSGLVSASFSPDNSKLYVAHLGNAVKTGVERLFPPLIQFDLEAGNFTDIIDSETYIEWNYYIDSQDTIPVPSFILQLGPDGKLYNGALPIQRNAETGQRQRIILFLNDPNKKGILSNPSFRYLSTSNTTYPPVGDITYLNEQIFPNFMQSYFNGLEPVDNNITEGECASIELTIFPNPSSGHVNITGSRENCLFPARINIYDAVGRSLFETEITVPPFPILNLQAYASGSYFLVIETFNKRTVKKIVIQ